MGCKKHNLVGWYFRFLNIMVIYSSHLFQPAVVSMAHAVTFYFSGMSTELGEVFLAISDVVDADGSVE